MRSSSARTCGSPGTAGTATRTATVMRSRSSGLVTGYGQTYMPGQPTCTTPGCFSRTCGGQWVRRLLRPVVPLLPRPPERVRRIYYSDRDGQHPARRHARASPIRDRRVRGLRGRFVARELDAHRERRRAVEPVLPPVGDQRDADDADCETRRLVRPARRRTRRRGIPANTMPLFQSSCPGPRTGRELLRLGLHELRRRASRSRGRRTSPAAG